MVICEVAFLLMLIQTIFSTTLLMFATDNTAAAAVAPHKDSDRGRQADSVTSRLQGGQSRVGM